MNHVSSGQWAHEQFRGLGLGDPRWQKRLAQMGAQAARRPGGKVTAVIIDDAERQGAYGLLESEKVPAAAVARTVFEATARQCVDEEFVFCAVDGTSLTLTDYERSKGFGPVGTRAQGARGLKVINALALSQHGVPLGLTSQEWWTRSAKRRKEHRDTLPPEDKEIGRWREAMEHTRDVLKSQAPSTRLWFQLDREGDAWPLLEQADKNGHWFTIRGHHNRRLCLPDGRKGYLREVLEQQPEVRTYQLSVTAGYRRRAREATMVVRTCSVVLDFRDKATNRHFPKEVTVVLTREQGTTPAGEKPIEWMLLTNRPIATMQDLNQVIFGYSLRWRIEDFHRTWKSGACCVEDSQLRSPDAVKKWATILAAVAVRIERIKLLSREQPERPASDEFTPVEIRAITLLYFGTSAKKRPADLEAITLGQATFWVAKIGGYTGKSSGGAPGSVTLARGLREVATAVRALEALQASRD
jgi:hypothetical protein